MGNAVASNASTIGSYAYVFADAAMRAMHMSPQQWSATLSGQTGLQTLHEAAFASSLSAQSFSHAYMTPAQHETVMKLQSFIASHVLPVENILGQHSAVSLPVFDSLREKARQQGLWNLFLQYTNTEYAPLCEVMGQVYYPLFMQFLRFILASVPFRAGNIQLPRARHRQHGSAVPLRNQGAEGPVAAAADGCTHAPCHVCLVIHQPAPSGPHSQRVRDDRACGGIQRRNQHFASHVCLFSPRLTL